MKTCPKCGIVHNDDAIFCSICGANFSDYKPESIEDKKKELKKLEKQMDRGAGFIAGGFAIIIFNVILFLLNVAIGNNISFYFLPIAIILLIIGFSMFGIPYRKSQKIKKEYPILIVSENKIKKH